MAIGQEDAASGDALRLETMCELLRGLLAAAVGIDIEGEINGARAVAQLSKLAGVEVGAQRAGDVAKTGLPQHGQVEQPFDQDHGGKTADGLPGKQSAFGARQQTVRKRRADTAAVEVDDLAVLAAGENHPVAKGIAALAADQAAVE